MRRRRVVRRAAQGLAQRRELPNQTEPVEGFRAFRGPAQHETQSQRCGYLNAAEDARVEGPFGAHDVSLHVFLPVGAVDGRVELQERTQRHRRRVTEVLERNRHERRLTDGVPERSPGDRCERRGTPGRPRRLERRQRSSALHRRRQLGRRQQTVGELAQHRQRNHRVGTPVRRGRRAAQHGHERPQDLTQPVTLAEGRTVPPGSPSLRTAPPRSPSRRRLGSGPPRAYGRQHGGEQRPGDVHRVAVHVVRPLGQCFDGDPRDVRRDGEGVDRAVVGIRRGRRQVQRTTKPYSLRGRDGRRRLHRVAPQPDEDREDLGELDGECLGVVRALLVRGHHRGLERLQRQPHGGAALLGGPRREHAVVVGRSLDGLLVVHGHRGDGTRRRVEEPQAGVERGQL
mmetsp:Transcript_1285/g.5717  ORF Transcript_1285/g.5717 Transcript_1285/m.5717 type:complete len:399 (-) Transcript_1285:4377-5573(-)